MVKSDVVADERADVKTPGAGPMDETVRVPVELLAEWTKENSLDPTDVRRQEASLRERVAASQGVELEREAGAEAGPDRVKAGAEAGPDEVKAEAEAGPDEVKAEAGPDKVDVAAVIAVAGLVARA
mgnify:CR=1 FL=1